VPSVIMPVICAAGHGFCAVPTDEPSWLVLQLWVPAWSCMSPGFSTPPLEMGARTHPPDSCITMARMKRLSTPVEAETLRGEVSFGRLREREEKRCWGWCEEMETLCWVVRAGLGRKNTTNLLIAERISAISVGLLLGCLNWAQEDERTAWLFAHLVQISISYITPKRNEERGTNIVSKLAQAV
jgi:hypothetical protein